MSVLRKVNRALGRSQGSGQLRRSWSHQEQVARALQTEATVCVYVCVCVCGAVGREAAGGSRVGGEEREESWWYPEDLWASSLSFCLLICGNGSVDLSLQGLGSGLRVISV